MKYFQSLVEQSISRAKQSTLSILGISDPKLRAHLNQQMSEELGAEGCFLASPVFEHTFGWEPSVASLESLAGELLEPELVQTLANADGDYKWPRDRPPYTHQREAWQALLDEQPRSAVVTSGTGSGKTECFMIPILNNLLRERKQTGPLVGVRALFLYPLNALINSQQERLDAWTRDFGEDIRFCLYNGNTEQSESKVRKEQGKRPNQVLSRELLRRQPSPILLTNSTMLEYMLVRQDDAPILEISRQAQSLRWIVLDEAHTYIGSQAAELSLLLRRVLYAFGREAKNVRFVATSATIADKDADAKLRSYLASLAGVDEKQVMVVGGSRSIPPLVVKGKPEPISREDIEDIEPQEEISPRRYQALVHATIACGLRNAIVTANSPQTLDELLGSVKNALPKSSKREQQREVLAWIDLMTGTKEEARGEPFLKLRAHFFQRMLHGLWSCIDPHCPDKTSHLADWPFGNLYVAERARCSCSAPVYEVSFCNDCAAPHLLTEDQSGTMRQRSPYAGDEFALSYEQSESDHELAEAGDDRFAQDSQWVIAPQRDESGVYSENCIDAESLLLGAIQAERKIRFYHASEREASCYQCDHGSYAGRGFYRQCYLGAPFYITNAVPTILEYCPDPDKDDLEGKSPEELPGRGRKLITFTDSRQGTARLAVKMQQEAERSRLRGLVFEVLRNRLAEANLAGGDAGDMSYEQMLAAAENVPEPARKAMLQAAELMKGRRPVTRVNFDEMTRKLTANHAISTSMVRYNKYANPDLFGSGDEGSTMARLLLAREFSRRPKNQNSTETLGIVRVNYEGLESIQSCPQFWDSTGVQLEGGGRRNLNLDDWRDFLKVALDFHVRENTFLQLEMELRNWMGSRFFPKILMPPTVDVVENSHIRKWPHASGGSNRSRLIKLLELATGKDTERTADRDTINAWLEKAWKDLVSTARVLERLDTGYSLALRKLNFSLADSAWECPVTGRLLDTAFTGLTPYLPRNYRDGNFYCTRVTMPAWTELEAEAICSDKLSSVRRALAGNPHIAELRSRNLWTDLSDRIAEGGYYYRTAEHSAQQSSEALKLYEALFKRGEVNVLNCSTTMEMGVDIGGISAVVMNNVPPHPANYLQRAGRAGRRSESRAIAYILCKKDPHNQRAFANPKWPFVTAIPAPSITLNSERIVQRHAQSLVLAIFLRKYQVSDTDNTKLNVKWFFHGGEDSPCHKLIAWVKIFPQNIEEAVNRLVRGTALANASLQTIIDNAVDQLTSLQQRWVEEFEGLQRKLAVAKDAPYKKALELELKRHEEEYLLRDLAARAYLPGYGFPTDVVNINTYNIEEFRNNLRGRGRATREDNIFTFKEKPSRGLDLAIREYAPGSQIVVDGRVYRSAGISLHWHSDGHAHEAQKFDIAWQCRKCGASGLQENAFSNSDALQCNVCSQELKAIDKRQVLRPAGFLTDFYESTSNDISSQKFIRIEKPRITVQGTRISLPDERLGFIQYGHNGSVFHHSSGEHEKGYAVCMACGRAESMLANGDIPAGLSPGESHRPIGGPTGAKKDRICSGEQVKASVYLGYQTSTDVLEVYLRSPNSGEWLPDNQEGRAIGATLAVALRDEIAARLGIVSTEMGFATRPDLDPQQGAARTVIQVFDKVSGGGGFCVSEVAHIGSLLEKIHDRLQCPKECDNVCSACLAGGDSRVEMEELDRHAARRWLETIELPHYLALPECFAQVPGARHCAISPIELVRSKLHGGADTINVFVPDASSDIAHADFRQQILEWKLKDGANVRLLLASDAIPEAEELKHSIELLTRLGVEICEFAGKSPVPGLLAGLQVGAGDEFTTLVTNTPECLAPGKHWLQTGKAGTLVTTGHLSLLEYRYLPDNAWKTPFSGARVLEIQDELNGPVRSFSERFAALLRQQVPELVARMDSDRVTAINYRDRYLASPWTVLLLEKLLASFPLSGGQVEIQTLAVKPDYGNGMIFQDWSDDRDQQAVITEWIGSKLDASVQVKMAEKPWEMSHGRVLTLNWASGKTTKILLDQGVGYWRNTRTNKEGFNFNAAVGKQVEQMDSYQYRAVMIHGGDWHTFMTVINH